MDAKRDLHVVSLFYKLRPSDRVTYVDPVPPVEFETEEARFRLAEGRLTCEMQIHFSTADEARAVVGPVLRAWEADSDLRRTRGELRFNFDGATIIDRSSPPGAIRGQLNALLGEVALSAAGTVSFHVTQKRYPEPPGTFRLNPDAGSILLRYQGYLDGREPLQSMAYFCLTVLEASTGASENKRSAAAMKYGIEKSILRKMGDLTSEKRGDRSSARKATAGPAQPLTGPEAAWIEAALKKFVWRAGDIRPAAELSLITMADLPKL